MTVEAHQPDTVGQYILYQVTQQTHIWQYGLPANPTSPQIIQNLDSIVIIRVVSDPDANIHCMVVPDHPTLCHPFWRTVVSIIISQMATNHSTSVICDRWSTEVKRTNWKWTNWKSANRKRANCKRANWKRANHKRADIKRANPESANPKRAHRKRVYLKRAIRKRANLRRVNRKMGNPKMAHWNRANSKRENGRITKWAFDNRTSGIWISVTRSTCTDGGANPVEGSGCRPMIDTGSRINHGSANQESAVKGSSCPEGPSCPEDSRCP